MSIYDTLNEQQREAVFHTEGPLLILAGAGSGKTRVLTHRIAYLIEEQQVNPWNILAITFTNKAANEMKERVIGLLGDYAGGSLLCTIHSLCVRILRQNIRALNYPNNFIIMDEEDQKSLLKKIFKERQIDSKTISLKSCIHYISAYKIAGVSPERAMSFAGDYIGEQKKAIAYDDYEKYKEEHFMLDFDDLLLKTVELFENFPEILERWQRRFQYIHVDEFQDVSEVDYKLIKYLSGQAVLCVVGDPDQTIYSFRGADVHFILDFDKDFKPNKTIILDQNYRSTGNILKVSNNLIRKNSQRLEKNLYTKQTGGEDVIHHVAKSEEEEANWIANKIEDIVNNQDGVNYRDIAILYRANYLSRTIEQVLIRKGIDYRIFGGLKFFNRKEVKDALSYLRLVCNQEDLAFERIINTPARGIGKKTLENIQLVALNHQISLYDALTLHSDEIRLSNKSKKEVRILVEAIEKARRSTLPLHEMFEQLMIDVGYIDMLKNDLEDNRIDNIHELQRSIYDFQVSHEDAPTLENYLQDISLYTDNDSIDQGQYVSLMSIHMAKGLEFDYVFVLGLSEGIFPNFRSLAEDGDDGLEEERRLAYVAFTRARKQLFLTDSEGFSFVTDSPKISSRFIDEVGNEGIIHSGSKPRFKTTDYIPKQTVSKAELIGDNKVDDWKVGDLVNHDIFGKGVVVKVNKTILDIAFELPVGLKSLMANHKALKKLTN